MAIADVEHNPWASAPAMAPTTVPAATGVSDVEHNPWATTAAPAPDVSVPVDVAKSGASGIARGLVGGAALTPNIIGTAAQGLMKLNEMAGNPLQYISPGGTGLEQAEANKQAIAQAAGGKPFGGLDYKSQTTPGEYFGTGGEFLGSAIGLGGPAGLFRGTPGQIAKQVTGQVVAPAVASETAGQIYKDTPIEPYARAAAGLATGAIGAGLTGSAQQGLTRAQVKASAKELYKSPELNAAKFAPPSIASAADNTEALLGAQNFSRGVDAVPPAFKALDNLRTLAQNDTATFANVRSVDRALTLAARELGPDRQPTANAAAATIVKQQIRNYFDNLSPADLTVGDATKIGPLLRAANQDYAAQAAAFGLPKAMRQAQAYAKQNDIPIEEALAIRAKSLTPQERAQAAQAIEGGIGMKGLRLAAMADPTKNPLALMAHGIGAFTTGGATLPISTIGTAAGRASNFLQEAAIKKLRQDILNRSYLASTLPPVPPSIGIGPRAVIGGALGGYGGLLGSPYSERR